MSRIDCSTSAGFTPRAFEPRRLEVISVCTSTMSPDLIPHHRRRGAS